MRVRIVGCTWLSALLCGLAAAGPDDDLWAVRCATFQGPQRIEQAQIYERMLKQTKGLDAKLVTLLHAESESVLCYGRYARRFEAASGVESFRPDPRKDLELIRSLSLPTSNGYAWPFRLATLTPLPGQDQGPAEWEISKARGHWSLQVAVFYNEGEMQQRKQAAIEYCKLLRQQGHEAYYHHGQVNSSVCIGAFPKDAIQTVQRKESLTGRTQFTQKIVDPRLLALQQKFPHSTQNGRIMHQVSLNARGEKQRIPDASFPVEIPSAAEPAPARDARR